MTDLWDWKLQEFRTRREAKLSAERSEWIKISIGRGRSIGIKIHLEPPEKVSHREIDEKLIMVLGTIKKHSRRYLRQGRSVEISLSPSTRP